jgi:hypothetical protein
LEGHREKLVSIKITAHLGARTYDMSRLRRVVIRVLPRMPNDATRRASTANEMHPLREGASLAPAKHHRHCWPLRRAARRSFCLWPLAETRIRACYWALFRELSHIILRTETACDRPPPLILSERPRIISDELSGAVRRNASPLRSRSLRGLCQPGRLAMSARAISCLVKQILCLCSK